eukprot:gene6522-7816_t
MFTDWVDQASKIVKDLESTADSVLGIEAKPGAADGAGGWEGFDEAGGAAEDSGWGDLDLGDELVVTTGAQESGSLGIAVPAVGQSATSGETLTSPTLPEVQPAPKPKVKLPSKASAKPTPTPTPVPVPKPTPKTRPVANSPKSKREPTAKTSRRSAPATSEPEPSLQAEEVPKSPSAPRSPTHDPTPPAPPSAAHIPVVQAHTEEILEPPSAEAPAVASEQLLAEIPLAPEEPALAAKVETAVTLSDPSPEVLPAVEAATKAHETSLAPQLEAQPSAVTEADPVPELAAGPVPAREPAADLVPDAKVAEVPAASIGSDSAMETDEKAARRQRLNERRQRKQREATAPAAEAGVATAEAHDSVGAVVSGVDLEAELSATKERLAVREGELTRQAEYLASVQLKASELQEQVDGLSAQLGQ